MKNAGNQETGRFRSRLITTAARAFAVVGLYATASALDIHYQYLRHTSTQLPHNGAAGGIPLSKFQFIHITTA